MNLLAIDTAGPRLGLALLLGTGRVETLHEPLEKGHAERLFPAIAELLFGNGLGYPDLDRIAVTTGPGSFTGLRIGLAAARGLGLALDLPVIGVPSLLAVALDSPVYPVTVCLDARRGEQYVQSFVAPGRASGPVVMRRIDLKLRGGQREITDPQVPLAALAHFAAAADPAMFPPDAAYVREADAKPQDRARVALLTPQ